MPKATLFALFFILSLILLNNSCRKEGSTRGLTKLDQVRPTAFPYPRYNFVDNPLTVEGFELGKKLFYDTLLSDDHEISCGSCHEQRASFGTFEHDRSHGVHHSHTLRNAPVLLNLAWSTYFQWDGAYTKLTDAIAQPLTGHVEMGMDFHRIVEYLESNEDYRNRFKDVFHTNKIHPDFVLKALSQFTGNLVSYNSRYDKYMVGQETFTAQEKRGLALFSANCATCHAPPLFTDFTIRNNGASYDALLKDIGRMGVTGRKEDSMSFKVPSLRNAYNSSNYFHDGRYNTLHQVIDFYRFGMQQRDNLDPLLKNGIRLTDAQADDLFEFLRTLTDTSFLKDRRFSER